MKQNIHEKQEIVICDIVTLKVFKFMLWKNKIPSKMQLRRYFCFHTERALKTTEECLFSIITVNFYISKLKLLPLWNFRGRKGQVLRDVYIHLSLNSWTTSYMKSQAWISGSMVLVKIAFSFLVLGNNCPLSTDLFTVTKFFLYCLSLNCIFLLINLYDYWAL